MAGGRLDNLGRVIGALLQEGVSLVAAYGGVPREVRPVGECAANWPAGRPRGVAPTAPRPARRPLPAPGGRGAARGSDPRPPAPDTDTPPPESTVHHPLRARTATRVPGVVADGARSGGVIATRAHPPVARRPPFTTAASPTHHYAPSPVDGICHDTSVSAVAWLLAGSAYLLASARQVAPAASLTVLRAVTPARGLPCRTIGANNYARWGGTRRTQHRRGPQALSTDAPCHTPCHPAQEVLYVRPPPWAHTRTQHVAASVWSSGLV